MRADRLGRRVCWRDVIVSRQRMIRPEFFSDAELSDLPAITRLLFIGLWTLADREGRLRDRPRSIKMELLPADSFDVDEALGQLAEVGSIRRYEADGQHLIDIPGFPTYQHLHYREAPSILPAFKTRRKKRTISREASGQPEAKHNLGSAQPVASASASASTSASTSASEVKDLCADAHEFEDFWAVYPRSIKKQSALRAWRSRIKDGHSAADMTTAARCYADHCRRNHTEPRFIQHPATFIGVDVPYVEWLHGVPLSEQPNGNGGRSGRQLDTSLGVLKEVMADLESEVR